MEEIVASVQKLHNNKASGMDNIVNEFIKHSPHNILSIVVKLFNTVLETGIVPSDWTIGVIKPLYKNKGSIDDADNYRGITLLSCLGKLFTSCINVRLSFYIEGSGLLGEEQAGFRDGYSTLDHIFVLHSLLELYLSKKKRIYCAFVDFKKAFDLVDRSSLWAKMISVGINGNVIRVVYNMYENAKSCVKKGQNLSNIFACNTGVRQGENLSPLLFAIYLNDFEYHVSRQYKGLGQLSSEIGEHLSDNDIEVFFRLYILLYADDTIVLAESAEELQKALSSVHEYCKNWYLTVNTSKTKVVIFSRGKIRKYPDFRFGEETLEVVDEYVYLGTTFKYNGSFNKAMSKQVTQARRAMFNLIQKARKLSLPIDIQCELFDQLVTPILLYGSEVWGYMKLDQIERLHKLFLKSLLRLNKGTANCMAYGEVGRLPLQHTVNKRMVSYWIRLLHGKEAKLSYTLYTLLKKLHDKNIFKSKWITKIKSIIDNCGMSYLWDTEAAGTINAKWLKQSLELKLQDMAYQNWHEEIHRNSLCSNYKLFKTEVGLENYLLVLNPVDRINLCRFRCGNHKLPAAEGRYLHNGETKICTLCNSHDQGDEFHYLFVCPSLSNSRSSYIKKYYYTRPNTLKMNELLNIRNPKQLSKLAKFVTFIMSHF